jgi:hypothetical protein
MNCRRREELIPLYVEGDLGEQSASQMRAHLQACAACRARAAEYEVSQAWLRAYGPPDFDEAFVDSIRAGVMRELAASEATPPFVERLKRWLAPRRLAAATAALIVILIALALFIYSSKSRVNHQDDQVAGHQFAPPDETPADNQKAPTDKPQRSSHAPRRTLRHAAPLLANHSRRDARRATTPQDHFVAQQPLKAIPAVPVNDNAATYSEERLRIEFQTADPNIRIIWFAPKQTDRDAPKPMGDTL